MCAGLDHWKGENLGLKTRNTFLLDALLRAVRNLRAAIQRAKGALEVRWRNVLLAQCCATLQFWWLELHHRAETLLPLCFWHIPCGFVSLLVARIGFGWIEASCFRQKDEWFIVVPICFQGFYCQRPLQRACQHQPKSNHLQGFCSHAQEEVGGQWNEDNRQVLHQRCLASIWGSQLLPTHCLTVRFPLYIYRKQLAVEIFAGPHHSQQCSILQHHNTRP